jgi:small subunit ribosomal protein S5
LKEVFLERKLSERELAQSEEAQLVEKVVSVNRVAKVIKGGRHFSFTAVVVAGYGDGRVGFGYGKANEVTDAIRKATNRAKKSMIEIPLVDSTIPHQVIGSYGAAKVLLKPASRGTGVIAGGPVRAICDCAGIKDILTKCLKSHNSTNVVKATLEGLKKLKVKKAPPEEKKVVNVKEKDK